MARPETGHRGRHRAQMPRGIRSQPRSSTPNRGRKLRWVCTTARGRQGPLQDVIGLDRINRANPTAGAGRRNSHRRQTGRSCGIFQCRTNFHPSDSRDHCVTMRIHRRGTDAPNRHQRQPSPQSQDNDRQKAAKPTHNNRQKMHRLIRSHNVGWFLLQNTEPVEDFSSTARGLRFPLGPPKALLIKFLLYYL